MVRCISTACIEVRRRASPRWERNHFEERALVVTATTTLDEHGRSLPLVSSFLNNRFSSTLASAAVGASAGSGGGCHYAPPPSRSRRFRARHWCSVGGNTMSSLPPCAGSISRRRLLAANSLLALILPHLSHSHVRVRGWRGMPFWR
ncbi:unnamed protein product, partial [Ixodes hexagonus]